MNEQELNEIEARAEAATPGPWFWDTNRRYKSTMLKAPQNGGTCVMDFTRWGMQSAQPRFNDTCASFGGILYTMEQYDKTGLPNPNADFIAHARQDVPALVADVRRLRAALEFYANSKSYSVKGDGMYWTKPVLVDGGFKASEALKGGAQ